jgi:hypothetical protein
MTPVPSSGGTDLGDWLEAHRSRIVKLADGRLNIPAAIPHMEGHNTWSANVPGSTLVFPVAGRGAARHPAAALPRAERHGHL